MIDRWFILAKVHQAGVRHSPMPKPKFMPAPQSFLTYPPTRMVAPSDILSQLNGGRAKQAYEPPDSPQFKKWEYRFWVADIDAKGRLAAAECRCCNAQFHQMEGRQQHLSKNGCSVKLVEAFKLLLMDKKCVICNKWTQGQVWGVPICSSGCEEAWCTAEAQPDALTAALQLVAGRPKVL